MNPWGLTFTILGLVVGYLTYRRRMDRAGLVGGYRLLGLWAIPFAALAARLAEFVAEGRMTASFFDLMSGGRSLAAAILGGWIGVVIGKRRMGLTRSTGEYWAPALALGEAVGRIGCFFNGCCAGTKCDLAWSIDGRHPAQLYSSVAALAIYFALRALENRVPLWPAYLCLYGSTRFVIEFFREPVAPPLAGLSIVQLGCLAALLAGGFMLGRVGGGDTQMLGSAEKQK